MNDFFEKIEQQLKKARPFVVYKKPDTGVLKGLFQNNDTLFKTSDFSESGFVFSPFNTKSDTILIPIKAAVSIETLYSELSKKAPNHINTPPDNLEKKRYITLVKKAISTINKGDFEKVVISRKEAVALSNFNLSVTLSRLLSAYTKAFVYCWYHPKVGLWLGATPETLLQYNEKRFATMALAGTQVFHTAAEVVWAKKEKNEQQLVTNFIKTKVSPLANSLTVSSPKTTKAGSLLHLQTDIYGTLKPSVVLKNLIFALHPTPAVCGLPMEAAQTFVLDEENYNRTYYSGFLGELNINTKLKPRTSTKRNIEHRAYTTIKPQTELYVNLRCMQIQDQLANLYIGGGITKDSKPESEWEETVAKSLIMKTML